MCETTPFLPCQKQLCSQRPVSVHVSLNDNELLLTPPLSSVNWGRKYANTDSPSVVEGEAWTAVLGVVTHYKQHELK